MERPAIRNRVVYPGIEWKPSYTMEFGLDLGDEYWTQVLGQLQLYWESLSESDQQSQFFNALFNEKHLHQRYELLKIQNFRLLAIVAILFGDRRCTM